MDKVKLGQKIRELRKRAGFSQRTLSDTSGVAYATLQDIEAGRGNPTIDTLFSLAKALGTTLEALTGQSNYAKLAVAEAMLMATGPKTMPRDLVAGLGFVSRFAGLQEDFQLMTMALVYEDETYLRLVSVEFREQFARLLIAVGK